MRYFDVARAYAQAGGDRGREAIQCLDAADRLAPQYVDPMARDLVLEVTDALVKAQRKGPRRGFVAVAESAVPLQ